MSNLKKPKWGYEGRYLFSDDGIRVYSDEAIQALAAEYSITGSKKLHLLKERLEISAVIYRTWKQNHDNAPRPGEMKAAIEEIDGLLQSLLNRLERLDDFTSWYFWFPETEVLGLIKDRNVKQSRFGHSIHRRKDKSGEETVTLLGRSDFFESLNILRSYCADAKKRIPPDPGGTISGEALRIWAVNVANLWKELSGKELTLDVQAGKPVTNAAAFCVDAFQTVDPGVPPSRVISALRKVIAGKSRKIAGKNLPKK